MDTLVKLPEWKSVALKIVGSNPQPGTLYRHEMLRKEFGIPEPTNVAEYKSTQLQYMTCVDQLKDYLLREHQIALRVLRGDGYTVVPPEEQTDYGVQRGMHGVRKALQEMAKIVTHVPLSKLSNAEIRRNTDARVHMAGLSSLFNQSKLVTFVGTRTEGETK